jgi:hypothetical protein
MKARVTILDVEFDVEYEIKITAHGSPETGPSYSSGGEPAEPAEFDVEIIELRTPGQHADVHFDLPQWLEDMLVTHLCERDDVNDAAQEMDSDYGCQGYDPDEDR